MNLSDFRARILNAVQASRTLHPDTHLHLLYAPELGDPLRLVADERRESALINSQPLMAPEHKPCLARLVTLDCGRIARYLLETDPGMDDPLFESSITQSYAEIVRGEHVQTAVTNDDPHAAVYTVCGWILSAEPAPALARRFTRMSTMLDPSRRLRTVRWYHPAHLHALWPRLSADHQRGLLGEAVWITHDLTGQLCRLEAGDSDAQTAQAASASARFLQPDQIHALENASIVATLIRNWQAMYAEQGKRLPQDAVEQMHRHVRTARSHRLDADDLAMYALIAVQLPSEALHCPALLRVLEQVSSRRSSLRDALRALPPDDWQRHASLSMPREPSRT